MSAYLGASAIGEVTPATGLDTAPSLFGTGPGQVGGFVLTPNSFTWPNLPPFVAITNLTNGQLFAAPANVPVRIKATDADGSVNSVTVRSNFANIAVIPPPYTFTFSNLAPGFYRIEAQATDNQGEWGHSAPVIIRVASPPVLIPARGAMGPLQFQFNSATGINYVVESGTLTNFSPVVTNPGTASPITYSETNASATQRTYRVRLQ